jgi:hypothetical protein
MRDSFGQMNDKLPNGSSDVPLTATSCNSGPHIRSVKSGEAVRILNAAVVDVCWISPATAMLCNKSGFVATGFLRLVAGLEARRDLARCTGILVCGPLSCSRPSPSL